MPGDDDLPLPVGAHSPANQYWLALRQLGTIPVEHRSVQQHLIHTVLIFHVYQEH